MYNKGWDRGFDPIIIGTSWHWRIQVALLNSAGQNIFHPSLPTIPGIASFKYQQKKKNEILIYFSQLLMLLNTHIQRAHVLYFSCSHGTRENKLVSLQCPAKKALLFDSELVIPCSGDISNIIYWFDITYKYHYWSDIIYKSSFQWHSGQYTKFRYFVPIKRKLTESYTIKMEGREHLSSWNQRRTLKTSRISTWQCSIGHRV